MITFQLKWTNGGETAAVVSRQHIMKSLEREMEWSWEIKRKQDKQGASGVGGTVVQCDVRY